MAEEIILGSRTDLHVQCVTMTSHIYRDVILEQHVRLFRGAMGAEFLFMDDNARPHRANIVDECLQSENITRMNWSAYSSDLNPIQHVWDMLDRRIAALQPHLTCLPELQRTLLDEWCNIPQDWIDNLILSMPRHAAGMKSILNHSISPKSKLALRHKVLLYKAILRPTMLYASPIWAEKSLQASKQYGEFDCSRNIGLQEDGWSNRLIAQNIDNNDVIFSLITGRSGHSQAHLSFNKAQMYQEESGCWTRQRVVRHTLTDLTTTVGDILRPMGIFIDFTEIYLLPVDDLTCLAFSPDLYLIDNVRYAMRREVINPYVPHNPLELCARAQIV
ncbi:transposable element Tcb1 transposase [Trichonephila clavipes]|nr:transposable element Tcb1 transposase [Trichonephila clavipes]